MKESPWSRRRGRLAATAALAAILLVIPSQHLTARNGGGATATVSAPVTTAVSDATRFAAANSVASESEK